MAYFLDPTGHTTYGIGLCDRCRRKFPLDELHKDPNSPGLRVCTEDLDQFDPWRLPARPSEKISLPFTRPDVPLTGTAESFTLLEGIRITMDNNTRVTQNGNIRIISQ